MIERVSRRAAFQGFGRGAPRSKAGPITLVMSRADTQCRTAVAYAIPRAVGSAVIRNRLRRQLRVVMANLDDSGALRPGAYLVVVRPEAKGAAMKTLQTWVTEANSTLQNHIGNTDDADSSYQ